jgi:hypothetical protein
MKADKEFFDILRKEVEGLQPSKQEIDPKLQMEAYANMYDEDYLAQNENGANGWRHYANMSLEERLACYHRHYV